MQVQAIVLCACVALLAPRAALAAVQDGENGTIIETTYGTLRCKIDYDGTLHPKPVARSCLGVPFAAPPLGNLRFAPPVAPQKWSGIRNATKYSDACMQDANGLAWTMTGPEPVSEDCLYLNVFLPLETVTPPPGGFPVMVFIYGGCWEFGSAAFPFYHGDYMEEYADKVILVSMNYRLGSFGFLGSAALQAQSSDGSTGNMGVQDQRMALRWVNDNIAALGGNPQQVMLYGESAGSGSTAFHLVAPRSAGLFTRAAMESGPYARWSSFNMTVAERHYQAVVKATGCSENGDGAKQIACLRGLDAQTLLDHYEDSSTGLPPGMCGWAPTIDGVELPLPSQIMAQTGQFHRVPVMLGTNENEGTLFTIDCDATDQDYQSWLVEVAGPDFAKLIYARYPTSDYKSPFWAASMVMTDACMACPARRTARWLTTPPKNSGPPVPVYLYHWEHQPDVTKVDRCLGVFHGSELPFVFLDKFILDPLETPLAKHMTLWWQTFAANGDPNYKDAPIQWPSYNLFDDQTANFDLSPYVGTNLKSDACDWWDANYVANIYLC